MNIIGLIISSVALLLSLKPAYQVWFSPNEYEKMLERRRKSIKYLPAVFKKQDPINRALGKPISLFILIIAILGIIFSITGPIQGGG